MSFNSKFASTMKLEIFDLELNMKTPDELLPFHPIDFLCMTVHDIQHFTDECSWRPFRPSPSPMPTGENRMWAGMGRPGGL
jgi:hypothetical protein